MSDDAIKPVLKKILPKSPAVAQPKPQSLYNQSAQTKGRIRVQIPVKRPQPGISP